MEPVMGTTGGESQEEAGQSSCKETGPSAQHTEQNQENSLQINNFYSFGSGKNTRRGEKTSFLFLLFLGSVFAFRQSPSITYFFFVPDQNKWYSLLKVHCIPVVVEF
jgi:hypothetical protein